MNRALLPLVALPLAAILLARRRGAAFELGLAAGAVALLALVLFSPHLALPDGVPSGAALLSRVEPWRSAVAPAATVNPEQGDLPYQVEPRLRFVRDELRAGRLPFWNPYAFGGYPLWAAAQAAPLSPFTWLFAALPFDLALFALPWLRFLIAGSGAWRLARELGVRPAPALLAAAIFAFSGRLVSFALYPLGGAIALVPWLLFAVERIRRGADGRRGAAGGSGRAAGGSALFGVLSALQWTSGHPETAAFTAVAALLWLLLARGGDRAAGGALAKLVAGGVCGFLVAGAALLPFLRLLPETVRYRDEARGAALAFFEIGTVLLRFLLPGAFGHPLRGDYFGGLPYVPTLLYAGALALPLAAVALARLRSDRLVRRLAIFGGAALVVSLAPPGVYHLFSLVPVLGRGLPHYFLPFALLALALLAALGLDRLASASPRPLAVAALAVAGALAAAAVALGAEWRARDLLVVNLARGAVVLAAPLVLLALRRRAERPAVLAALAVAGAFELVVSLRGEIPLSRRADLFAETPAIAALRAAGAGRIAGPRWTLPANTSTAFGVADLRGADAVTPARTADALGARLGGDVTAPPSAEESARLDRWSVRFWIDSPSAPPREPALRLVHDGADARIWERPGALPVARLESGDSIAAARVVARHPGHWAIEWSDETPAGAARRSIVVADAFDRGWRARAGDRELAIDGSDPLLLRIVVPDGVRRLELDYRPRGLAAGVATSAIGLVLLALAAHRERRDPKSDTGLPRPEGAVTIPAASGEVGRTR